MLLDNNRALLFNCPALAKFISSLTGYTFSRSGSTLKGNDMTKKKTTTKFMAGALVATIALTSFGATPAMAKPSNGVRILQGLAALYIVSRVIEGNKNDTRRTVQPRVTRRGHDEPRHRSYDEPRHRGYDEPRHRGHDEPRRRVQTVPQSCFERFTTPHGVVRGYTARCLANYAPHLDLPRDCKTRISTNRGHRKVYGKRCLRRYGFNVASNR